MKDIDPSKVHRLFYPDVPAVMCSSYGGRVSAMPVVSYSSLSEDPPLIGVSCSPRGFTCGLALKSGRFSLCWLDRRFTDAFGKLATTSGRDSADKLASAGLKHSRGKALDVPVVSQAVAVLECSVASRARFGDHVLLVGSVKAAYASSDFRDYWRFKAYRPILYTGWQGGLSVYQGQ